MTRKLIIARFSILSAIETDRKWLIRFRPKTKTKLVGPRFAAENENVKTFSAENENGRNYHKLSFTAPKTKT